MSSYTVNKVLDVKGLMCPMPLVKSRKAVMEIEVGEMLEVIATDKGSVKDFQGWAKASKNVELVEQTEEQDGDTKLYRHIVKRTK